MQEFIEGNDLNQEIKQGQRLGETPVIKLLIEILEVLEYVHQNQVIHRDIKPANIIRRRDGKIVLIDFGGIKQVRAKSANSTLLTAIVGTPGYMPIEQFHNNAQFCSDIHAVGMIGIFALTGIDPHPRKTSFPKSPQGETLWRSEAQVSPQLADILDKMVKFDYTKRYQSTTEVLADLKRLALSPKASFKSQPNSTNTQKNKIVVTSVDPTVTWSSSRQTWQCIHTISGHSASVYSITFNTNGQILASGSADKTIKLWQVSTLKEIYTLTGHFYAVDCIAISPDEKILASSSWDKTIKLWQLSTGKEIYTLTGHSGSVFSIAFSRNGQILASGSDDKTIKLWEVSTGKEIFTLKGHSQGINAVAIHPNGQIIASSSGDKTIKLWKVSTGKEIFTLTGHSNSVLSISFSQDGQMLVSGSADKTIKLWQVSIGKEKLTITGHSEAVSSVAFNPAGNILASSSKDKTVKLWQVNNGEEICTLHGHSYYVYSVAFSPDGRTLVSGSYDKTIKIWQKK